MDNKKRDEMITEIHGDVKVVKAGYEEHKDQISALFKRTDDHGERLTTVETKQEECPARVAARPATLANKLLIISIIVVVLLGLVNMGLSVWDRVHARPDKTEVVDDGR